MADSDEVAAPDFAVGVSIATLQDGGMMLGRVGGEEVVLARAGGELFAVGAHCTRPRESSGCSCHGARGIEQRGSVSVYTTG